MIRKVKYSVMIVCSFAAGYFISCVQQGKRVFEIHEQARKNVSIIRAFNMWMALKQRNHSLYPFFERNNYHEIAVYGMHYLGERLKDELQGTDIVIKYVIDKNAENIHVGVKVVQPEDVLEDVDAIIVTPIFYFEEIKRKLSAKVRCPIISLEDIINNA